MILGGTPMKNILIRIRRYALPALAGSLLFGVSVNMFLRPHGVITGGATGIATAAGKLWGIPVGLGIIIVNLPIFAVCIRQMGLSGMVYSLIGTALTSVAADLLMGIGAGTLLSAGFTTGGTDLAAYLIHKRHPRLSTGRMILFFDGAVIVLSALALRNFAGIMYSAICTVTYSASLDMVQGFSRRARIVFVISEHHETIARAVSQRIDRGVTLLSGTGYYTGKDKSVIMCVVGKQQEFPLRRLVLEIDPSAFIVIGEAAGVSGKGFEG